MQTSPSIVAAVSGGQRHRRRLVLSPSNPPSSPSSLPSSPPSPSSSSSQHQQAVAFHLRAVINTISSSSSSRGPQQSTPEAFHRPQTHPHATVEVEILEDMQLVHFDFNSTPFELHDDNYELKAMKFCGRPPSEIDADLYQSDGGSSGLYAASLILLLNRV
ncbi:Transcription factor-like protein DPB [Arachis hypogaea]|nr:Transcription factor-like protein DPB [Arachis hypogaea]